MESRASVGCASPHLSRSTGNPFKKLMNPIVNGIRYCGVVHGDEPRVFASIRLERRHTYGKHTAFGVRTVWKALSFRDLGKFSTKAEAKSAVKTALDEKRNLQNHSTP